MNLSKYFMSEAYKYVFALCYLDKDARVELLGITEELYEDKEKAKDWYHHVCYLDKDIRMELLGITEELYEDKEKAKDWYHHIVNIIQSDPDSEKAITKLNELYAGMVEE